jgi:hypothetical protein
MLAIDTTITVALAQVIRDRLETNGSYMVGSGHDKMVARNEDIRLALNIARELADNSDNFNPLDFLDCCSPDPEIYPLSELWEEVN